MTHGTIYAYAKRGCKCDHCRWRVARDQRRRRNAKREHVVPCLFCDDWFPTERGRNVHETRVHGS